MFLAGTMRKRGRPENEPSSFDMRYALKTGSFEANQQASGSVKLYGDVEYRGAGLNLAAGFRTGFVDATSTTGSATDINRRTTLTWRP